MIIYWLKAKLLQHRLIATMTNRTLKKAVSSCPIIAAYIVGHEYGVDRYAKETYQSPGSIYNKLNPDNDSNHLYLRDAVLLTEKSNNDLILETWASNRGYMLVRVPDQVCCDEELSDQVCRTSEEMGAVMGEIRQAREDGIIDPQEYAQITQRIAVAIKEALALKAVIKAQVRELPRHPSAVISKEA